MKITFHGAARTVTGSKHLLHINPDKKILLDCGMFQGMGKETLELNSNWGFDPKELTYVIISHAHIDHVGLLPKLVKDGYSGPVYCTPQTEELAKVMMIDSAHIQVSDVNHVNRIREKQHRDKVEPLYTEDDVANVYPLFVVVPIGEPYKIDNDVELLFSGAGHILGAACVNLKVKENGHVSRITFSGDVGRYNDILLPSPEKFPQADFIILESTYGNKLHDLVSSAEDSLLQAIEDTCIRKNGKLIIPAFSVGRTQEILYFLNRLETENRLPNVNIYVDSPLSEEVTAVVRHNPQCFNKEVRDLLKTDHDVFSFSGLHYTKSTDDSKFLTSTTDPCVIISASGMAEAGRVKHHIAGNIENPANTIMIVGYCEPHSLGGRLRSGATEVGIYGEIHQVKADIRVIESMSAHGDYQDLSQWLSCQHAEQVKKLFLVHGEYDVQQEFRERLLKKGFKDIEIPDLHQEIGLGHGA